MIPSVFDGILVPSIAGGCLTWAQWSSSVVGAFLLRQKAYGPSLLHLLREHPDALHPGAPTDDSQGANTISDL